MSTVSLEWQRHAACNNIPDDDVELFSAKDGEPNQTAMGRGCVAAARYCAGCPVLDACGDYATENKEKGLWGGTWRWSGNDGAYREAIPAIHARAHLHRLDGAGVHAKAVAGRAGVGYETVKEIRRGARSYVSRRVNDSILQLKAS